MWHCFILTITWESFGSHFHKPQRRLSYLLFIVAPVEPRWSWDIGHRRMFRHKFPTIFWCLEVFFLTQIRWIFKSRLSLFRWYLSYSSLMKTISIPERGGKEKLHYLFSFPIWSFTSLSINVQSSLEVLVAGVHFKIIWVNGRCLYF